jgi:beta-RFAP synthase
MGFMDLSASLGRNFGSIGVALNHIKTHLVMERAAEFSLSGCPSKRSEKILKHFCQILEVPDQLQVHFKSVIPEHVGLGSGTQMALAIGMALNHFYQLNLSVRDIATLSARGARSGIGIGVFEQGGLVVDGGRGDQTKIPPIVSQFSLPNDWFFILVFDRRGQGLHGQDEIQAFQALPPFPKEEAARLCHLVLMQGLPAIAEDNIALFGDAMTQLQQSVGGYFSQAQGGVFTSSNVATAMTYLQQQGAVGIGQTSWGPTGFCLVQGLEAAQKLRDRLKQQGDETLDIHITGVENNAARIEVS